MTNAIAGGIECKREGCTNPRRTSKGGGGQPVGKLLDHCSKECYVYEWQVRKRREKSKRPTHIVCGRKGCKNVREVGKVGATPKYCSDQCTDRACKQRMAKGLSKNSRICSHCNEKFVVSGQICDTCRSYKQKSGRDRPSYRFSKNMQKCITCERPCVPIKGECKTCLQYRYRHKKKRSRHLIDKHAPLGWCDCGEKAWTAKRVDSVHKAIGGDSYLMRLCETCAKSAQELSSISSVSY